jgi:ATP-dependent DNA helicase RecG
VESVTVTLLNLARPSVWDEVSDWIDREGFIQNAKLCEITGLDTLKASKLLTTWRDQGLLIQMPTRGKKNMAYTKPSHSQEPADLLSGGEDNKIGNP